MDALENGSNWSEAEAQALRRALGPRGAPAEGGALGDRALAQLQAAAPQALSETGRRPVVSAEAPPLSPPPQAAIRRIVRVTREDCPASPAAPPPALSGSAIPPGARSMPAMPPLNRSHVPALIVIMVLVWGGVLVLGVVKGMTPPSGVRIVAER